MSETQEKGLSPRKLSSWIASYTEYTDGTPTPAIFRKWAALSAVTGALERRAYIHTASTPIYPNLFVVLVSPPGVGKDQAIVPMRELWAATGKLNIAPISMTHKGLLDALADDASMKQVFDENSPTKWESYHSLLIAVPEFGVLIDKHDLGFLSTLNELYNCWNLYEERQRTTNKGKTLRIENPHIHIISGTQPKFLGELFPEAAYGMGFTARIIFVYSGVPVRVPLFSGGGLSGSLRSLLVDDLKTICSLRGPFILDKEAQEAIEEWHLSGSEKDKPTHSKLVHYSARRILHVLKLCMGFSVSRSNDLQVTLQDFEDAKNLLLETEAAMPEVFKEISSGGQAAEMEEAFNFIFQLYMKNGKKPVSEHRVIHFLSSKVPANQISFIIETMLRGGLIKEHTDGVLMLPGRNKLFVPIGLNQVE